MNLLIGVFCFLIAAALLVSALHDVLRWAFEEGRTRGRTEAENAFVQYEKGADQARQEIWREEANQ
jgi:hypothetical protein